MLIVNAHIDDIIGVEFDVVNLTGIRLQSLRVNVGNYGLSNKRRSNAQKARKRLALSLLITILAGFSAWLAWRQDTIAAECNDQQSELALSVLSAQLTQIAARQLVLQNELHSIAHDGHKGDELIANATKSVTDKGNFVANWALKRQKIKKSALDDTKAICQKASSLQFWSQSFSILLAMMVALVSIELSLPKGIFSTLRRGDGNAPSELTHK